LSETDSFIQEVSEEVRQDQMFALWKKWAPAIIGGIAVVVGGAAYWSWSTAKTQAEAEARGGQLIAAEPGQVEQFTALPDQVDGPAKLLAELTAAAVKAMLRQSAMLQSQIAPTSRRNTGISRVCKPFVWAVYPMPQRPLMI